MRVIADVQAAHPATGGEDLRTLLSAAYPFGERRRHPYHIWLDYVNAVCKRRRTENLANLPLFENISQEITRC